MIKAMIDKYNEYLKAINSPLLFAPLNMYIDGLTPDEIKADIENGTIQNPGKDYFSMIEEPQPDGTIKIYLKGFSTDEIITAAKTDNDFLKSLLNDIDVLIYILKEIYK